MRIISKEARVEFDEVTLHCFKLYGNKGEDFREGSTFYIDDKKFKIFTSKRVDDDPMNPLYVVLAVYKPQTTKFNYDWCNWLHVSRIERTSPTEIIIKQQRVQTTITFDNAKECLKEYLLLQNLWREGCSSDEFAKFKRQNKKRLLKLC